MDTSSKVVAACVVAFGALLVSEIQARRAKDSAAKMIEKTYEIEATHLEFLLAMVQKYKIPDTDKAARISVQFAISDGDAKAIFETKRCNTCGGKKKKQPVTLKLYPTQAKFISAQVEKFKLKSEDKAMRCILEYALRDGDQETIFTTTRCKTCNGRG